MRASPWKKYVQILPHIVPRLTQVTKLVDTKRGTNGNHVACVQALLTDLMCEAAAYAGEYINTDFLK